MRRALVALGVVLILEARCPRSATSPVPQGSPSEQSAAAQPSSAGPTQAAPALGAEALATPDTAEGGWEAGAADARPSRESLDAKSIERVVRKDRPWERCLANSPDPPAKIAVRFVIEPSGRVSDVRDAGSIRVDAAAMKCILSAFSGLTFPQHQGGPITLVFPVTF